MTLKEYRHLFTEELSGIYPKTEIETFFFWLIEEHLSFQRIDQILQADFKIPKEKFNQLQAAKKRLLNEEPIQYIIGKTEFYGFPFFVDQNTLIPRPETEELVEYILNEIDKNKPLQILDIGTGTGCISISLAKHLPNAIVSAIDISKEALIVSRKNAELNDVTINFIEQDILKTEKLSQKYDVIVSNPPYVRELEKVEIKNNVLENEPHLALFVDNENPLLFYKKIADLAKNHLTKNGILFFEINQYLGKETLEMLQEKGFQKSELQKDLFGNDRIIKAQLN
jgi:release factor glutamine methyltransferase